MHTITQARLSAAPETCPPAPAPRLDETVVRSLAAAADARFPFRHLRLEKLLPAGAAAALGAVPCAPLSFVQALDGPPCAGRRARRLRLDGPDALPLCQTLARIFASPAVTALVRQRAGVEVGDCAIRLSLVQDVDGYACEPCTGEGEARFRIVVALPPSHQGDLGPDLYAGPETWAAQLPWRPGSAFAFAPAADTWHGFEPRLIRRLRASLVIDYVAG